LKEDLIKALDYGQKLGADYVEVRTQKLFKTLFTTKDGKVEAAMEGTKTGQASEFWQRAPGVS
jgi:predicted Zn-dependent protease